MNKLFNSKVLVVFSLFFFFSLDNYAQTIGLYSIKNKIGSLPDSASTSFDKTPGMLEAMTLENKTIYALKFTPSHDELIENSPLKKYIQDTYNVHLTFSEKQVSMHDYEKGKRSILRFEGVKKGVMYQINIDDEDDIIINILMYNIKLKEKAEKEQKKK